MRNALQLDAETFVVIDNSGCVGQLPDDAVSVANEVVAYYSARVTVLELLCVGAQPTAILLANFTGDAAWAGYVRGIERLFEELGWACPTISGSTETNFQMKQSAFSITMIGRKKWELNAGTKRKQYYVIGEPLVGEQLVAKPALAASMRELVEAVEKGIVKALWPTGSKGIFAEMKRFIGGGTAAINGTQSAGPSTAVLVATDDEVALVRAFTAPITKIEHIGGE